MDHWHRQRRGAEQVTAPLSVARTKLAKSRHKLASHIFSNVTLFFIYFPDPLLRIFSPHRPPFPPRAVLVPNPLTSERKAGIRGETTGKPPALFVCVASERQLFPVPQQ